MTSFMIEVCGGGGTGRSSIAWRFTTNRPFTEWSPTIEDHYFRDLEVDGMRCQIDILDTGYRENVPPRKYGQERKGYLLTFALTSRSSFHSVEEDHHLDLHQHNRSFEGPLPTVIVGNKCDLEEDRQVTEEEATKLAASLGCPYFETSAKDNVNLDAAFSQLIREMRRCYPDVIPSKKRCYLS